MNVIIFVVMLGSFGFGFAVSRFMSARRKQETIVLIYDGQAVTVQSCKAVSTGIELKDKTILPSPQLRYGVAPDGSHVYLVGIEYLALAEHKALEHARLSIVWSALFKPGGDLAQMLQIGALCIPLAVSIYLFMRFNDIFQAIEAQSVTIKLVEQVLSKPLVVAK